MNYTGDRRSVLTLAHELGHGLHGYLAEPLGLFNASSPLTTAETASVFGEALTFKRLLAIEEDPQAPAQPPRRAHRGLDRDRLPADRDEPLRGRRAHDAPRGGRALARASFEELWLDSPDDALRRLGRHRRLRDVVELHPALHRHARVRLRVRVRLPLRALDLPQVRARGRLDGRAVPRRAARGRLEAARGARARWSASISPIRRSGRAGSTRSRSSSTRPRRSRPDRPRLIAHRALANRSGLGRRIARDASMQGGVPWQCARNALRSRLTGRQAGVGGITRRKSVRKLIACGVGLVAALALSVPGRVRWPGPDTGRHGQDDHDRRHVPADRARGRVCAHPARDEGVLQLHQRAQGAGRQARRRRSPDRLEVLRRRLQPREHGSAHATTRRAGQGLRHGRPARDRAQPRGARAT